MIMKKSSKVKEVETSDVTLNDSEYVLIYQCDKCGFSIFIKKGQEHKKARKIPNDFRCGCSGKFCEVKRIKEKEKEIEVISEKEKQ
jgi:hypothetical protein